MDKPKGFEITGFWELLVEWDVLAAASFSCLDGFGPIAKKEKIAETPASVTYQLLSRGDSSNLGTVEIRKLRTGVSQIHITGVPLGAERLQNIGPTSQELQGKPRDVIREAWRNRRLKEEERRNMLKDLQRIAIQAYFSRLQQENIWPDSLKIPQTLEDSETSQKEANITKLPSDITAAGIDALSLDNSALRKGPYRDFSADKAREFLKAIVELSRNRQGHNKLRLKDITTKTYSSDSVVSNHFRVLYRMGLRTVDGIPLPYKPRKATE